MPIRALRCRLTRDSSELAVDWWSGSVGELEGSAATGAYVVPEDTVESLKNASPRVNDRGRKHNARSLSVVLLGQPRLPVVRAAFSSDRQVKNSIRSLLENAERRRERKAYIIGVPSDVFEQMAARVPPADDEGAPSAMHLIELIDHEEVPPMLEEKLVGRSLEMQVVRQQIVRAAREDVPVLVQGDTGTGKELVARQIHAINPSRCHQPFVSVNCGAIPSELFESDVFGYLPGSFTGALRQGSEGLWRFAKAGTIFLDEIGDLAPVHQVKILRVLEERRVRPVGSATEVKVDARVIAATNRDLYSMTETGEFREDLYYRLASMVINLPTLRDREEDVARLASRFWSEVAPKRPPLSADVLRELGTYRWHGNARELRYIVMNLHTTFPKSVPTVDRLRAVVQMRAPLARQEPDDGPDATLQQVDRLRHLQRARAAIDGCQRLIRRFGGTLDADRRAHAVAEIGSGLTELQLLAARADRFDKPATFEAIHRLAGGVAAFQSLLAHNDSRARRYGRQHLAADVTSAASAVRRDEERILKSL